MKRDSVFNEKEGSKKQGGTELQAEGAAGAGDFLDEDFDSLGGEGVEVVGA